MYALPCPEPISKDMLQKKADDLFMEHVKEVDGSCSNE